MKSKTTYERFFEIIVNEKEKHHLTSKQFAEMVGVSKNTMSSYLNQKARMPADILFSSLAVFGYTVKIKRHFNG